MNSPFLGRRWSACSLSFLLLALAPALRAATNIAVSDTVATAAVRRLGINISFQTYYDSRLMMKELCYRNPGFEGQIYQSVVRVASANGATVVDDNPFTQWTDGFWNNAAYEFITGAAKGRSGTVAAFLRRPDVPPGTTPTIGSTYTLANDGAAIAAGDYFVVRKIEDDRPDSGWWVNQANVTLAGELADLPSDTLGRQALRATSTAANGSLQLASNIDTWPNVSFIQFNGAYAVRFKAKTRGPATTLTVRVARGNTVWANQPIALTPAWTTYTVPFTAAENGTARGIVALTFGAGGTFDFLLDDVSFTQTDGDPANPSPFRDAMVAALRGFRPSMVRGLQEALGETLDNLLTPAHGRRRAGYTAYGTQQLNIEYGYHEFLELCETVGAEPWFPVPVSISAADMANLLEYLGGPTTTPYGARRARLGHPRPWTEVFSRLHLEFGNEAWNGSTYQGGVMTVAQSYGSRASEIFAGARASPWYSPGKYDLVLGAHAPETQRNLSIHNASTQHDSLTVDGYFYSVVDNFANDEELFGSMFAQSELFNTSNYMFQNYRGVQSSARPVPLSIYEANINTLRGAITGSQAALDALTPSLGAGLAVANDMLMKLRELKIRDQCLFNLGGYSFQAGNNVGYLWGVTRDMGVTDRKRPTYLAAQLANEALHGDLVQTTHSGDNPTWSAPAINQVVGGLPNAHYLHSYAFAAADGRRAVVVFNVHRRSPLAVTFTGPNAPTGTVTLRRLTSAAITDHNEADNVVAPVTSTLTGFVPAAGLMLPPFSMSVLLWNTRAATVPPPVIVTSPAARTVQLGDSVALTVAATGEGISYQWWRNGTLLPGATGATYAIARAGLADRGSYVCVVENAGGQVSSAAATLAVLPARRLANLSVRTALAEAQALIVGFVVEGGAGDVLVRAAGPALGAFGVPNLLSDPRLELFAGNTALATNDDWAAELAPVFGQLGAFAFPARSRDAALRTTLRGVGSVVVTGNPTGAGTVGSGGTVLVELYDASTAPGTRLVNLSVRTRAGGPDPLIAGLVVSPVAAGEVRILLRAAGPSLANFGVTGALADPTIELYAGDRLVARNDDWLPADAAAFTQAGAFAFTPGSKDASLVTTVGPAGGSFSLHVRGVTTATGEVLIEVYELPP